MEIPGIASDGCVIIFGIFIAAGFVGLGIGFLQAHVDAWRVRRRNRGV